MGTPGGTYFSTKVSRLNPFFSFAVLNAVMNAANTGVSTTFNAVSVPANATYSKNSLNPLGGDVLMISGYQFGQFFLANIPVVVQYGTTGVEFTGVSVTHGSSNLDGTLYFKTIAGSGSNLVVTTVVGGQRSAINPLATISYTGRTVTSVSGPGAVNAPTAGGSVIVFSGVNFGSMAMTPLSVISVQYGNVALSGLTYLALIVPSFLMLPLTAFSALLLPELVTISHT
jgi:hypothetical protein